MKSTVLRLDFSVHTILAYSLLPFRRALWKSILVEQIQCKNSTPAVVPTNLVCTAPKSNVLPPKGVTTRVFLP